MILTVSQREKKKFYRLRVPFWCCISYIYSKCMRKTVSIEWRFMFTLHRIQNKRKKNTFPLLVMLFLLFFLVACLSFFVLPCDFLFTMTFDLTSHWNGKRRIYFWFFCADFAAVPCKILHRFYFAFIWNSIEFLVVYSVHVLHIVCKHNKNQPNKQTIEKK